MEGLQFVSHATPCTLKYTWKREWYINRATVVRKAHERRGKWIQRAIQVQGRDRGGWDGEDLLGLSSSQTTEKKLHST